MLADVDALRAADEITARDRPEKKPQQKRERVLHDVALLAPGAFLGERLLDLAERQAVHDVRLGQPALARGAPRQTRDPAIPRVRCASGLMAQRTPFSLASRHQRQSRSSR